MAHTIKGNAYTTFHVNGDFSGDVTIVRYAGTSLEERIQLPMEALDVLYAEKIRSERMARLEQMSSKDLLEAAILGS